MRPVLLFAALAAAGCSCNRQAPPVGSAVAPPAGRGHALRAAAPPPLTQDAKDAFLGRIDQLKGDLSPYLDTAGLDATRAAVAALPVPAPGVLPPFPDDEHSHSDDPAKHAEHTAMLHLVPAPQATHFAAADGKWSDPNTWRRLDNPGGPGELPPCQARVWIPAGRTVTLDQITANLKWLRVDGAFRADPAANVHLRAVTVVATPGSEFTVGTDAAPQQRATVTILDRGPRDPVGDPMDMSGGLILHGRTSIVGTPKATWLAPSVVPKQGDTVLTFAAPPAGWAVGDKLLVTGVSTVNSDDQASEERAVAGIDGATVTLDAPLANSFHGALPGYPDALPVGNLTRSVLFTSANPDDITRRGHCMLMHGQLGVLSGIEVRGFGRTDARRAHTNTPDGDNQMGRYGLHLHIVSGASRTGPQMVVRDCVVADCPKHGIVSHGANALVTGNIVLRARGSGIFHENGTEIGTTARNLAVGCLNPNASQIDDSRTPTATAPADFGGEGVGLWFQGGGVDATDNVSVACSTGLEAFTRQIEGTDPRFVPVANLRDAQRDAVATGRALVPIDQVPGYFARNVQLGCGIGVQTWNQNLTSRWVNEPIDGQNRDLSVTAGVPTEIADNLAVGCRTGLAATYTKFLRLTNCTFAHFTQPGGVAYASTRAYMANEAAGGHQVVNCRFTGYDIPPIVPGFFDNVWKDSYVDCEQGGLAVREASTTAGGTVGPRTVTVSGMTWGPRTKASGNLIYGPGAADVRQE